MLPFRHIPWIILLFLSAVPVAMSLRMTGDDSHVLQRFEISPEQYFKGYELESIRLAAPSNITLAYHADVDNAWVNLNVQLVHETQGAVADVIAYVSNYYGVLEDGKPWREGSSKGAIVVHLPAAGAYRIRVSGVASDGKDNPPDLARYGVPMSFVIRDAPILYKLHTIAFAVLILAAIILFLRAFRVVPTEPEPQTPVLAKERLLFLDGLRGLAALAVVLCHLLVPEFFRFAGVLESVIPTWLAGIFKRGHLGVEVFFVLSGFVIAYSLRGKNIGLKFSGNFVLRRALRLDPPYYLILALSLAYWAWFMPFGFSDVFEAMRGVTGIMINMVYAQDLLEYPSAVPIAWTLCLEVQFYLAFITLLAVSQFIGKALKPRAAAKHVGSAPATSSLPRMVLVLGLGLFSLWCWYPTFLRIDFFAGWFRFCLGVLAYWTLAGEARGPWLLMFVAAILGLSLWTHDERGLTAAITAISIYVAGRCGGLASWLAYGWLQFLGRISYSLYLVHILAGTAVANTLWAVSNQSPTMSVVCAAVAVATSLLAALVLHRFVEQPSGQLSKQLTGKKPIAHIDEPEAARASATLLLATR